MDAACGRKDEPFFNGYIYTMAEVRMGFKTPLINGSNSKYNIQAKMNLGQYDLALARSTDSKGIYD